MAKSKKKPRQEEQAEAPSPASPSLLLAAYRRFDQGDVKSAGRAARALLERQPSKEEEAAARQLVRELRIPGEPDAHALARRLLENTRPPPKAYALGLVALAVAVLMVVLAAVRY